MSRVPSLVVCVCVSVFPWTVQGQGDRQTDTWKVPPQVIRDIVAAPELPSVSVDPARAHLVLADRAGLPDLKEMARPMLRLAGHRIDPATNGRHGPGSITGLRVLRLDDGTEVRIVLPQGAEPGMPSWSPDGSRLVFTNTAKDGIELWIADPSTGKAQVLLGPRLNGAMGSPYTWMPGGSTLLVRLVLKDRGPAPEQPAVPAGPAIQETAGRGAPVRTYQDLLRDAHDEALFDHYMTCQLAFLDAATGVLRNVGPPAVYTEASPSPDGTSLLVTRLLRPYSYLVTASSFADLTEVWTPQGEVTRAVARRPVRDNVPLDGVPTGPRGVEWQDTAPATLVWVEALDGGDPKKEVPHRDRIMRLAAPFTGDPEEIWRTEHRYSGLAWLADGERVLVADYDRDRRWSRTWLASAKMTQGEPAPRLVWDKSTQDSYGDPGRPVHTRLDNGRRAVLVHDGAIWLTGNGASPQGDRPFLDRMDLASLETNRLWQCEGERYEEVDALLADDASRILIRHETKTEPPNYVIIEPEGDLRRPVTNFEDPLKPLRGMKKELVRYARKDGVPLSATLYLPPDYQEGQRLPLIVWAYPREFNSASTAGQVRGSPWRYTRVQGTSHLLLLTQGYAIMDGATMPVVGDPETANDTFVEQIVDAARAAIDKAVELGVADGERVGVGGHSYGAFMTANLLAHSDLFKCGIARSGAYNRSLTPFGFQNERRTFWEAPAIYAAVSPFMHADRVNEPILLIHGSDDNNSGTFPLQSERFYHAIKGHGGTSRLVMLPHESHGYRARESVLHVLAEMVEWFDRWLKTPVPANGR